MFSDPQFWVFVAFCIFVVFIFRPVKKNINSILNNKINEIKDSLNKAEKLKNDAQQTLSEIKKRQNDVQIEIELMRNKSKEEIVSIGQESNKKLNEQIIKRNLQAKAKIDQIIRDANIEIQKYIVENVIKTTIKILEKKLNQSEKQNLINQSITELNSTLKI